MSCALEAELASGLVKTIRGPSKIRRLGDYGLRWVTVD